MDATTLSPLYTSFSQFHQKTFPLRGGHKEASVSLSYRRLHHHGRQKISLATTSFQHLFCRNRLHCFSRSTRKFINADSVGFELSHPQTLIVDSDGEKRSVVVREEGSVAESLAPTPGKYKNRFLNFVRIGSVVDNMADFFFKSEIRRRLFVTALLIVVSRVGYFIPLPGFDRRLMPQDYLSFASGSTDELGDFSAELKLSLFQLGISPQIAASILMQVLCHILPSLVRLRKEGLDGHEKIKGYMCV